MSCTHCSLESGRYLAKVADIWRKVYEWSLLLFRGKIRLLGAVRVSGQLEAQEEGRRVALPPRWLSEESDLCVLAMTYVSGSLFP